jgi:hypothetical protein
MGLWVNSSSSSNNNNNNNSNRKRRRWVEREMKGRKWQQRHSHKHTADKARKPKEEKTSPRR